MNLRIPFFAGLFFLCSSLMAGEPLSFKHNLEPAPARDFAAFSPEELAQDVAYFDQMGRDLTGKIRLDHFDFFDFASKDVVDGGTEVWRLRFHSDDAQALTVYFDAFHLPVGCEMWIYNADGSYFEGPIDSQENKDHKRFVTNDIYGEDIILEYIRPVSAIGEAELDVRGIGYLFRYVEKPASMDRMSDPCQVDINCPEGEVWDCQRDAVVRLRITDGQFQFLCTGVMVNTTHQDCRQYMLSALHCADGVSSDDFGFLQVRFGYQKSGCGLGTGPSSRNRTGVVKLADSNDNGGNNGSDFILFEVEGEIPDNWDPYFAGWNANNVGDNFGAGIHYPSGDWKKISHYTTNLTSEWWGAPGSHWGVVWSPTESGHGVTEGGSSGSPIFNSDGLIIGTLTGGLSACEPGGAGAGTGPNQKDYYGKMSHHWTNNPNSASQKLRVWLDPLGSDGSNGIPETTVLHGSYRTENTLACGMGGSCDAVSIEEAELEDERFVVSPNPTNGLLYVRIKDLRSVEMLSLYDQSGKLVRTLQVNAPMATLDLQDLPQGMYYLVAETAHGASTTRKVVKY